MTENETKTAEQKKRDLYLLQKELLATLLEHGVISQAQNDKSLRDLTAKMGMQPSGQPNGKAPGMLWWQRGALQRRHVRLSAEGNMRQYAAVSGNLCMKTAAQGMKRPS